MADRPQFPFPSLDFPKRKTLRAAEIAEKLGVSDRHIVNLIKAGHLPTVNGRADLEKPRGLWLVTVEGYRDFIVERTVGHHGGGLSPLLTDLPGKALVDLFQRLRNHLIDTGELRNAERPENGQTPANRPQAHLQPQSPDCRAPRNVAGHPGEPR